MPGCYFPQVVIGDLALNIFVFIKINFAVDSDSLRPLPQPYHSIVKVLFQKLFDAFLLRRIIFLHEELDQLLAFLVVLGVEFDDGLHVGLNQHAVVNPVFGFAH